MRRWAGYAAFFAVALLCAAAQVTVAGWIAVGGARPDFLLALAFAAALCLEPADAAAAGWAVGMLKDVLSIGPPGIHAVAFGLMGLATGWVRRWVLRDSVLAQGAATFVAAGAVHGGLGLWTSWTLGEPGMAGVFGGALSIALYTGVAGPFLVGPLLRYRKAFSLEETDAAGRAFE